MLMWISWSFPKYLQKCSVIAEAIQYSMAFLLYCQSTESNGLNKACAVIY